MMGLFEKRKRTTAELVRETRDLLCQVEAAAPDGERMAELAKNIRDMKTVLYGSGEAEPVPEACAALTQEVFRDDVLPLLMAALPKLDLEARKDSTQVVANLQRQQVGARRVAADYLAAHPQLLDQLVLGYENLDMALHYGTMLRECIRHQVVAKYVLESDKMMRFFDYVELPNFDVASDAAATFRELLTRHKTTVAEFLARSYEPFFAAFNARLLESPNYLTRWQSVKLLGDVLFDRCNVDPMVRYVGEVDNLRVLMNLLREPSHNIRVEAFHVFKVFVANMRKPAPVVSVLVANRPKLLHLLSDFGHGDDPQLDEDIAQVMREIEGLDSAAAAASDVNLV